MPLNNKQTNNKNVMCCFEQILEATPLKTAAVRPITSHLTSHLNKTNKTYEARLKKQEQSS